MSVQINVVNLVQGMLGNLRCLEYCNSFFLERFPKKKMQTKFLLVFGLCITSNQNPIASTTETHQIFGPNFFGFV